MRERGPLRAALFAGVAFARPERAQRWRNRSPCYLRRLCSCAGPLIAAATRAFAGFVKHFGTLVSHAASIYCTHDQGFHHASRACIRADGRRLFGDQIPARSAAQPLHSARERQPKRASSRLRQPSRGLHLFLRTDCGIGQRTPAAASLPASLLHREQQGQDERPRDGPLRLPNEDKPTCHVLDGSHGARAPTFTTVRQRLRAAREARLLCRWNTGSRGTFTGAVDGDHPEEEEESEEPAEEDAPGGHGRRP